jgi:hypothetical protein
MLQTDLINALKSKNFEEAIACAARLGEQALRDLKSAPDNETRTAIFRKNTAALADALHLARVLRAHLSAELNTNTGTLLYQQVDSERNRWRIHA